MLYSVPNCDDGQTVKLILRNCQRSEIDLKSAWNVKLLCLKICQIACLTPVEFFHVTIPSPDVPNLCGVSGVLIVKESHIAIHTWPESQSLRILIDSCKDFNIQPIVEYLSDKFDTKDFTVWIEKEKIASKKRKDSNECGEPHCDGSGALNRDFLSKHDINVHSFIHRAWRSLRLCSQKADRIPTGRRPFVF